MQAVDKGKETPMERLKRLRAAQINKAFQQEALTVAQRKLQEEKDRRARETIERAAAAARRSPSPPSPHRWHAIPPSKQAVAQQQDKIKRYSAKVKGVRAPEREVTLCTSKSASKWSKPYQPRQNRVHCRTCGCVCPSPPAPRM